MRKRGRKILNIILLVLTPLFVGDIKCNDLYSKGDTIQIAYNGDGDGDNSCTTSKDCSTERIPGIWVGEPQNNGGIKMNPRIQQTGESANDINRGNTR